jgi:homoserine O-succinyltransferase
MPLKEQTELQLARVLSSSKHDVEVTLAVPDGAKNKNTSPEHMASFYKRFSDLKNHRFDAVLVTGAPVEHLPFTDVMYWDEMIEIFEWIRQTETSMLSICWGAMASLYHFHGVPKHVIAAKLSGVFPHKKFERGQGEQQGLLFAEDLTDGVGIPVSRHTEWRIEDMQNLPAGVDVLLHSDESGPCLIGMRTFSICI